MQQFGLRLDEARRAENRGRKPIIWQRSSGQGAWRPVRLLYKNKREHILNKQQQRFLKINLLLITQEVNIILRECKLYV